MEMFTDFSAELIESTADELGKVYRLNSWYVDEKEYFAVLDDDTAPKQGVVAKQDYLEDLQIQPIADPKQATQQQKVAAAQAAREVIMGDPLTQADPTRIYPLTRDLLDALGVRNIEQKYPPFEPPGPTREDDPELENAGALMPKPQIPPVHMDQNHTLHIMAHEGLMNDEIYGKRLTPDGKQQLHDHIQMHIALQYMLTETDALETIGGETPEGRNPELAAPSGGTVVPIGA